MLPAEHLARADDALEQAIGEVRAAADASPEYGVAPLQLAAAELTVARRRLMNAARVLGSGPTRPAA